MKTNKGFTLVELVIILCVLAIITCIAVPSLRAAIMRANDAASISALRTISQAQNQKFITSGRYYTLDELIQEGFVDVRFKEKNTSGETEVYSGYEFQITLIPAPTEEEFPNYILSAKPYSTNIVTRSGTRRCGIDRFAVILCDKSDTENHFKSEKDLNYAQPLNEG